ncbi:MAG: hypothetical protein KJO07_17565 [Deltaproteobacteria bacterium]|nr:hypothetical protein [Deltaproteobacteria bacterium]
MRTTLVSFVLGALATGCIEGAEPEPMPAELYGSCDAIRLYQVTAVQVPVNVEEAVDFGLDLDGDRLQDNTLGTTNVAINSVLAGRESDWAQRAIDDGRLTWFIEVESCDGYTRIGSHRGLAGGGMDSGGLRAVGVADAIPADGEGFFPISAFAELPGNADNDVRWVRGLGLSANLRESGGVLQGSVGIGITPANVRGVLLPTFAMGMSRIIRDTDGCPLACPEDSDAWALVELFDEDVDGVVTADELADNSIVGALSYPDVDLIGAYNGEPVYWPGHDQVADHMSVGIGIEAVEISRQSF